MNSKEKIQIIPFASLNAFIKHHKDIEDRLLEHHNRELLELSKALKATEEAYYKTLSEFTKIERDFSQFKESVGELLVKLQSS